jgi:hypothetical protein
MKQLSPSAQKTYEALQSKANSSGRMPSLRKVSELLNELEIPHRCSAYDTYKYSKSSGVRYYTGGGNREYKGFSLNIPSIRLYINSTDTYYSWNTWMYAQQIVKMIEELK